ncbi:MAG TPA: YceI family protein [Bryobacteraceae bacterium]|jgi:polyisoprenoid-binding protein YceI|nr:YceI family protein [Bryobacteraceae bacterium]
MSVVVYTIDPAHSSAHFSVRHMMISNVKGEFTKLSGTVTFDRDNPAASQVEAIIEVASLHTRDEQRDAHLKSPDFLDAEKFPDIRFVSKSVERNGHDEYQAKGDMTIHGVTHEVTLQVEGPTAEVKDPWGNIRAGATAMAKINRKDFGLVWNVALETGGVLVGEEVKINLEVELTRHPA